MPEIIRINAVQPAGLSHFLNLDSGRLPKVLKQGSGRGSVLEKIFGRTAGRREFAGRLILAAGLEYWTVIARPDNSSRKICPGGLGPGRLESFRSFFVR
jgi:hypothetical protein